MEQHEPGLAAGRGKQNAGPEKLVNLAGHRPLAAKLELRLYLTGHREPKKVCELSGLRWEGVLEG